MRFLLVAVLLSMKIELSGKGAAHLSCPFQTVLFSYDAHLRQVNHIEKEEKFRRNADVRKGKIICTGFSDNEMAEEI